MRNLLIRLAAGAVGGIGATYLLTKAMPLAKRLPASLQPVAPNEDPGHFMVKQAERVTGPLSPKLHSRAAQSLHMAYGITWPLGLAALSGVLGLRSAPRIVAAGAVLGLVCWLVGYEGWLPAAGLAPPAHRVPLAKNATALVSHVAYGTLASLPLALAGPRLEA